MKIVAVEAPVEKNQAYCTVFPPVSQFWFTLSWGLRGCKDAIMRELAILVKTHRRLLEESFRRTFDERDPAKRDVCKQYLARLEESYDKTQRAYDDIASWRARGPTGAKLLVTKQAQDEQQVRISFSYSDERGSWLVALRWPKPRITSIKPAFSISFEPPPA